MATIRIKRRTSGAAGSPSTLAVGEPAYNEVDDTLWVGVTGGLTKAIGGLGNFVALTGAQTVSGAKTFSGAATFSSTATFIGTTSLATATATTPATSDNSTNVATTAYVRAQNYLPNTTRLDQLVAAGADYSMGGFKLTNLAAPVNPNDAARKADVDAAANGLDVKMSVRAATTANITLSGAQTIDGVSVVAGDRVLVKNQTTTTQNGIYVAASGAWARSPDADTNAEVHAGMFTFVTEGTTNADTGWVLATNDPITLGTTGLTFAQFSGGGVPGGYVGQTTITTLGTITTGTWQATTIAPAYGGTGLTSVLNGLVKGNGTAYSAAVAGADYLDNNSTIDGGTF